MPGLKTKEWLHYYKTSISTFQADTKKVEDFMNRLYRTCNLPPDARPSPQMLEAYLLLNEMSDLDIFRFFQWFSPFPNDTLDGLFSLQPLPEPPEYKYTAAQRDLLSRLYRSGDSF